MFSYRTRLMYQKISPQIPTIPRPAMIHQMAPIDADAVDADAVDADAVDADTVGETDAGDGGRG